MFVPIGKSSSICGCISFISPAGNCSCVICPSSNIVSTVVSNLPLNLSAFVTIVSAMLSSIVIIDPIMLVFMYWP